MTRYRRGWKTRHSRFRFHQDVARARRRQIVHAALELIREARQWFEQHEPSSPIPVLLGRAEQFVGKRYAEVVRGHSSRVADAVGQRSIGVR